MSDPAIRFHMIEGGPTPVGPFSHATECDGWVFVTGQMPDTPELPGVLPAGIEAQTRNVMRNLRTVLAGIGLDLRHVTMARVYLTHFPGRLRPLQRGLPRLLRARPPAGAHLHRRDRARLRRPRRDRPGGPASAGLTGARRSP